MDEQNTPDLLSLVDDDGNELEFEVLDSMETEKGRYLALVPVAEEAESLLEEDGELVILKVVEGEDNEEFLEPIEDEDEFNEISAEFMSRLEEYYDFKE